MNEIGYLIKQTQHTLRLKIDEALNELNLTLPQYVALSHISVQTGISNAELARRAFVTPQTMHRIVTGLEKHGLLNRKPHPQLERVIQLFLTEEGKRLLSESGKIIAAVEAQSLAQLSSDEVKVFRVLLQKYLAAIEEIDN